MIGLKKGDIVDIIAPGYLKNPAEIKLAEKFLQKIGLIPRIPKDLVGKDLFHSNCDETRAKHLIDAIKSDSKAIWCLRGGYGSAKLLPFLEKIKKPQKAKLLIGYSDITALHLFFNQKWNWESLHASTIGEIISGSVGTKSTKELISLILGKKKSLEFTNLKALNSAAKSAKNIQGKIFGGNLALIQTSLGTDWQVIGKNNILFFEDCDEEGYRIDRMLYHCLQAGIFKNAKAILFGDFVNAKKPQEEKIIKEVILNFSAKMQIPCFYIKNIGHGKLNYPLPLNINSVLKHSVRSTTLEINY